MDAATDIGYDHGNAYGLTEVGSGASFQGAMLAGNASWWAAGGWWNEIDAFIDTTCRNSAHSNAFCSSPYALMTAQVGSAPMITTPTFLRIDLKDWVLFRHFLEAPTLFGQTFEVLPAGAPPDLDNDYAILMRDSAVTLFDDLQTNISVYAPNCGEHVGLTNQKRFFDDQTYDTDDATGATVGSAISLHGAVKAWFNPGGATSNRARWIDSTMSQSVCQQ